MEHGVQVTVLNYAVWLVGILKKFLIYTCHLLQTSFLFFFFLCAALVAEVTQPSLGVGYELGRAIENKKKILCLFRPDCGKCKLDERGLFSLFAARWQFSDFPSV